VSSEGGGELAEEGVHIVLKTMVHL
jgi:hypothetical protein